MQSNNFKNGIFIVASLILFCVLLFFFGLSEIFVHKAKMASLFGESVQGLSVGSQVKYKGVPVGSVTGITILANRQTILVNMNIELKAFSSSNKIIMPFGDTSEFRKFINQAFADGLRSRIEYAGITGLRYIELDYYEKPGQTILRTRGLQLSPNTIFVPSVQSVFKDLARSLNTSLERISKIKFDTISENLIKSLQDVNAILTSSELSETLRHLRGISRNLDQTTGTFNKVLTEKRLESLLNQAERAVRELTTLSQSLRADSAAAKLGESATAFRSAAEAVKRAANSVDDRRYQAAESLEKLNQTLDALRELLNTVNDDPSSLIGGRRQSPVK